MALLSILALAGCGSNSNNEGSGAGNQLSSLAISSGTLSPTFASGTADYTASVANDVIQVTVTPTAKDSGATIKVNTVDATSGEASGLIDLAAGTNTITIVVTGSGGKATNTYTVTVTRAAASTDIRDIGGACQCEDESGNPCFDATTGNSLPAGGNITNCDVPTGIAGAVKLCLRSFQTPNTLLYPSTYFASGYCSLGTTKCSLGALCSFGNYDNMVECPTGSVLITDSATILNGAVTLNEKVCAKPCNTGDDCRKGQADTVWGTTDYTCSANLDKCTNTDNVKFCYDARNLTNNCVVTAF
jgi:hypothetical protein